MSEPSWEQSDPTFPYLDELPDAEIYLDGTYNKEGWATKEAQE